MVDDVDDGGDDVGAVVIVDPSSFDHQDC